MEKKFCSGSSYGILSHLAAYLTADKMGTFRIEIALKSFRLQPFFVVFRPRNVSNWVRAALGGIKVLTPWNEDGARRCASTVLDWEVLMNYSPALQLQSEESDYN